MNINEAIKAAGPRNVRIVPMPGQPAISGLHSIEIRQANGWVAIVSGLQKAIAENIVREATNRIILG